MPIQTLLPISSLAFLLATGALSAQEGDHKATYRLQYKRFTRGDNEKIADEAKGRIEWFRERMGGDLSPEFMFHIAKEAARQKQCFPAAFLKKSGPELPVALNPGGSWVNIGPTGSNFTQNGVKLLKVDGGRLRTILPDPSDSTGNTVYALSAGGGLWKSIDFLGTNPTWIPKTDLIGTTAGGSVAFGRATSTLYLGTGDPFDSNVGGFFVKSADGGDSWSAPVALGSSTRTLDLKVDTTQAQDIILIGTNQGLFRSDNAGTSFTQIAGTTGGAFAGKSVWSLVKTNAGWLAAAQVSGGAGSVYLSTDLGLTWTPVSGTIATDTGRITFGIGQAGDAVVYAFAANTGNAAQKDLYRSTDGGQTWTALNITTKIPSNPNSDQETVDVMQNQAFYNHMILVDPTDTNRSTVYLGGQLSCVKSTDGGQNFTVISNWLAQYSLPYMHADFHCAAFSNFGGIPRLYMGTDGGLSTSTDGGVTWDDTKNKGRVDHLIYTLTSNPESPSSVLVGLQDNGTRLRDGSTTIYNQPKGGDGFGVGWSQVGSAASLASYVFSKISVSTANPPDDQTKWRAFTTGIVEPTGNSGSNTNNYFVTAIVSAPPGADVTGNTFFHYTRSRVYRTVNAGGSSPTWEVIGAAGANGLPTGNITRSISHGVSCSPGDRNRVAVAGPSSKVFITQDGGASWNTSTITTTVPAWGQNNSNIAWANNSLLYACSETTSTASTTVRVVKSLDGGNTWAAAGTSAEGLPALPITKLVVDPGDGAGNTVYAATWLGVYRTTNGGSSWSLFGTGLPQVRVTDIYLAPNSSYIRVSTWGRGVWEIANSPVAGTVSILPTSAFLYTGDPLTFTGTVNGGGSVTYTATGGSIGASTGSYVATTPGTFTVTAANSANLSQLATASVTVVNPTPVSFPTQPLSKTAAVGHTATFSATAVGSGTLTYQWKKNGTAIIGATMSSYTTPALALADNGAVYTCEVTGRAGMVASDPATLTVSALGTAITTSNATVTAIPDAISQTTPGTAVEIPFTISGATGSVGEVTFSLYLTHTYAGDLVISLIAPDNSSVALSQNAGRGDSSSTAAFGTSCGAYTVFSDLGTADIGTTNTPPAIVGTFKPSSPLDAFNSKAINGTWKLRIQDTGAQDTGSFQCGTLTVTPFQGTSGPSFDINSDSTTDVYDLLEFLKVYGSTTPADLSKADFNRDGQINNSDLTLLLNTI